MTRNPQRFPLQIGGASDDINRVRNADQSLAHHGRRPVHPQQPARAAMRADRNPRPQPLPVAMEARVNTLRQSIPATAYSARNPSLAVAHPWPSPIPAAGLLPSQSWPSPPSLHSRPLPPLLLTLLPPPRLLPRSRPGYRVPHSHLADVLRATRSSLLQFVDRAPPLSVRLQPMMDLRTDLHLLSWDTKYWFQHRAFPRRVRLCPAVHLGTRVMLQLCRGTQRLQHRRPDHAG